VKEFREFVLRGNVVDLAVAFVIGAAFAAVITSFVTDVLTPLLGLVGIPDFRDAAITVGTAEVRYGRFLNALIAFLLVAAAIYFFVVKPMNALAARRKTEPEVDEETKSCPECLSRIPSGASRCAFCAAGQPS
jgi:large conductance mechanosensitive channel